jgi:hypothetical protein
MATIRRAPRPSAPVAEPSPEALKPPAPPSRAELLGATKEDGEIGSSRVDYVAVIQRYQDKVSNRGTAIRAKCVECSGGALSEVRDCPITKCALWPYRMGTDPNNKKTAAKLAKGIDNEEDEE